MAKKTIEIISDTRKDLEQAWNVSIELLKTINSLRLTFSTISPLISTSSAKPITSPTIQTTTLTFAEPSSSSPFLNKDKKMLKLKAKLLSKGTIHSTTQTKRFVPSDIFDPFLSGYYKITQQVY